MRGHHLGVAALTAAHAALQETVALSPRKAADKSRFAVFRGISDDNYLLFGFPQRA